MSRVLEVVLVFVSGLAVWKFSDFSCHSNQTHVEGLLLVTALVFRLRAQLLLYVSVVGVIAAKRMQERPNVL